MFFAFRWFHKVSFGQMPAGFPVLLLLPIALVLVTGCSGVARTLTCVNPTNLSTNERLAIFQKSSIHVVESNFQVSGRQYSDTEMVRYMERCGETRATSVIKDHESNAVSGTVFGLLGGLLMGLGLATKGEFSGMLAVGGALGLVQSGITFERGFFYRQRASKIFNKNLAYSLELRF